jgi:hypothetical protein
MSNTTASAFRSNDPVLAPPVDVSPLERLEKLEREVELLHKELQHQKEFNKIILDIIQNIK